MGDHRARQSVSEFRRKSDQLLRVAYALLRDSDRGLLACDRLIQQSRACLDAGAAGTLPIDSKREVRRAQLGGGAHAISRAVRGFCIGLSPQLPIGAREGATPGGAYP
jgi:hypothetical protein